MANRNGTTKAQATAVQIGQIVIEGIMLPDGSFAVSAPQIAEIALDGTGQKTPAKTLKRICSKHSTATINWGRVRLGNSTVTYVSLADFQRVVRAADRAGHTHVQAANSAGEFSIVWSEAFQGRSLKHE